MVWNKYYYLASCRSSRALVRVCVFSISCWCARAARVCSVCAECSKSCAVQAEIAESSEPFPQHLLDICSFSSASREECEQGAGRPAAGGQSMRAAAAAAAAAAAVAAACRRLQREVSMLCYYYLMFPRSNVVSLIK